MATTGFNPGRFERSGAITQKSAWTVSATPATPVTTSTTTQNDTAAQQAATSYYDVDTSLKSAYDQAKAAGVTVNAPSSYGQTITDQAKAQQILNDYTARINAAAKAQAEAASYFDVDSGLNELYTSAKTQGINVNAPTAYGKTVKTQAAADSAYKTYYDYLQTQYAAYNQAQQRAAIQQSITDTENALTHADKEFLQEKQSRAAARGDYKAINPAYIYWLRHSSNGTGEPPYYLDDAQNESYSSWAAREQKNAAVEAKVSAVQAELQANYDKVQRESGTTHARNSVYIAPSQQAAVRTLAAKPVSSPVTDKKLTIVSASDTRKAQEAAAASLKAEVAASQQAASQKATIATATQQEAKALSNAVVAKQAEIKQTANPTVKAELKAELKELQTASNNAQKKVEAAKNDAVATANYAKAVTAVAAPAAVTTVAQVKAMQTAAVQVASTSAIAQKVGVQDHSEQVLLKNGTWIDKIQRQGATGAHEAIQIKTQAELTNELKQAKTAMEEAQKAADTYKAAHGTLNNIEISGGRNPTEQKVKVVGSVDENGRQYVQAASSVYALQKTANKTITAAMISRANAGSTADIKKIGEIQGAQEWLKENKVALDIKTIASTPITSDLSTTEVKQIKNARDKVASSMKFDAATRYKVGLNDLDYEAQNADKAYHKAVANAAGKYSVVDEDAFKQEFAEIAKATKGMTDAQKKQYLIDRESKTLPSSGKASDLWEFLNTDLVAQAGISGSVAGTIKSKFGDKTAQPLTWGNSQKKISKTAISDAAITKSTTKTTDVLDNIARKQLEQKPLTASETALLAQISGGYKQGALSQRFSNSVDSVTSWTQTQIKNNSKEYKAGDNFIGVPLTTTLAEWANALQSAAGKSVGVVGGTVSAIPKVAGYTLNQASKVRSLQDAENAASTIAASGAIFASTTGRGMKQEYDTSPKEFIATMAYAQALFSVGGKAISVPTKYAGKQIALKTGLTRAQTLGSELIPYKEAGSILDEIRYNKQISGMHGANRPDSVSKTVHVSAPGNTIYVEPGTFGAKGRFATLSDEFVDPFGKFFTQKRAPRYLTRQYQEYVKPTVSKAVEPVTSKIVKKTTTIDENGVVRSYKEFKNQDLNRFIADVQAATKAVKLNLPTSARVSAFEETIPGQVLGSAVKKVVKSQTDIPKNLYNDILYGKPRTGRQVVDKLTGDTVKLSKAQWDRVYTKFSRDGNFWDEYKSITETAQKQANKLSRPVAIPSPKVAKGIMEAENEVFWIFPEKGVKITSRKLLGTTDKGVKVYDTRYGKQKPVTTESFLQRIKENRSYNSQVVKAVDGKNYNLNYIKSYAKDANRRLGELYGNKLTRPDAYEAGKHGKTHTEQVGKNITAQKVTESAEMDYWLGVMHDITKVGPHESAGIPHAVAAAEAIKRGFIKDARFNKFYNGLSKAQKQVFYKAIGEHTTIKPVNRHLLTEWDISLKNSFKKDKAGNKIIKRNRKGEPVYLKGNPVYEKEIKIGSDVRLGKSVKGRVTTLKEGVKTALKDKPSIMSKATANADRFDFVRFGNKPLKRMTFQNLKRKSGASSTTKTVDSARSKLAKATERKSATVASRVKWTEKTKEQIGYAKMKKAAEQRKAAKVKKSEDAVQVKQTQKRKYEIANSNHTSYKAFVSSLGAGYSYLGSKGKTVAYAGNYRNGAYGKGAYSSVYKVKPYSKESYPSSYKSKAYNEKYSQKKYEVKPKEYQIKPKEYKTTLYNKYSPTKGYSQKYAGSYTPKPGSYKPQYTSVYKGSSSYPNKYNTGAEYKAGAGGYSYNGKYSPGNGYTGGNYHNEGYFALFLEDTPVVLSKKKTNITVSKQKARGNVKLQRSIQNRLGSLDSILGGSSSKSKSSKTTKPKSKIVKARRAV